MHLPRNAINVNIPFILKKYSFLISFWTVVISATKAMSFHIHKDMGKIMFSVVSVCHSVAIDQSPVTWDTPTQTCSNLFTWTPSPVAALPPPHPVLPPGPVQIWFAMRLLWQVGSWQSTYMPLCSYILCFDIFSISQIVVMLLWNTSTVP